MQSVEEMMKSVMDSIKSWTDGAEIVGKPIVNGDGTIILPVCKLSYGFVASGANISQKPQGEQNTPLCAGGGGVTVTPLGFLICGREKRFVRVDDNSSNKWMNLFNDIMSIMKKDD